MQNVLDVLIAAFVFLLFVSVYRKRGTATVRLWMTGWLFILLHFAALALPARSTAGSTLLVATALFTLVLSGIAFVLSREEIRTTMRRAVTVACLLGLPWLAALLVASLPPDLFAWTAAGAYAGSVAMVCVATLVFRRSRAQLILILCAAMGCAAWLTAALPARSTDTVVGVILTECFSLVAVLLSFGSARVSAGTVTTSMGAFLWSLVWVTGAMLGHVAPSLTVHPEVWNLPKYLVATGMILTLLEDEIRAAARASEEYRLLFASNPHPMWMFEPESFQLLQGNDAAVSSYGYTRSEFSSMTMLDLMEDRSPALISKLRGEGPQQLSGPWRQRRRDGTLLQVDIASQPVVREGRHVMFALMHDVTERQRLHAQLVHQAHHDALTDLPNRILFEQHLQHALERAAQTGNKVALFCIDLDRFKQINDTYGHTAGDLCLKEVASRILKRVEHQGTLARRGGDEFVVLLRELSSAEEAEAAASLFLHDLKVPMHLGNEDFELGASIGFAVYPDDEQEGEQLWRDADAAMYEAKRAGGAQWVRVSYEISSSASQASEVEVALRRALKQGGLCMHYQPQVTPDGRLHSFEALLRSTDPSLAKVPTDRMIAIAEESNLIVPLGNWVLEEVCRQCREWLNEGLSPAQVALNVSPLQLTRFAFSKQVAKVLERYRLTAWMLEFEVTESTMMPDHGGDAPHQIATLAGMGIRFSVDDFGTGYSSLGRLHQLPVDSLKIDRSFTRHIADLNSTYPTVEAIVALAHTFGMKVVAEGVETEEQARLLKALHCDRMQGFLFSRPLPPAAATAFLRGVRAETVCEVNA